MPHFSGKTVVVTGCSSGVGAAAVTKFAARNATVYRRRPSRRGSAAPTFPSTAASAPTRTGRSSPRH